MGRKAIKKEMMKRLKGAAGATIMGTQATRPQSSLILTDPYFIGPLSQHIAARKIKHGISKGAEIARLDEQLIITNPILPPEKADQPIKPDELKKIAQRLFDLGYYYQKNPEKEEIEYTLAPNYSGLVGKASQKEQDSLQAAIKRFQRVHGFTIEGCNGCLEPEDKTLSNLNSETRISLRSYNSSTLEGKKSMFTFESKDDELTHNHLHPILWNFMDIIEWFYEKQKKDSKKQKKGNKEALARLASNIPREVVISYASGGYIGDGHKELKSKHYKARAIDIISINNLAVSNAPRELKVPDFMNMPPALQPNYLQQFKTQTAMITGPVISFAHIIEDFKNAGEGLPITWKITELDSPWHGDKENHQDHIHIAVGRKIHIGKE